MIVNIYPSAFQGAVLACIKFTTHMDEHSVILFISSLSSTKIYPYWNKPFVSERCWIVQASTDRETVRSHSITSTSFHIILLFVGFVAKNCKETEWVVICAIIIVATTNHFLAGRMPCLCSVCGCVRCHQKHINKNKEQRTTCFRHTNCVGQSGDNSIIRCQ